jgi:hypothetical protein
LANADAAALEALMRYAPDFMDYVARGFGVVFLGPLILAFMVCATPFWLIGWIAHQFSPIEAAEQEPGEW